jgi:gliding motility-associated-like protein
VITVDGGAPVVNAGSDKLLLLPEHSVTLAATVPDVPDGPVTDYNWTQESGPETSFNPFQQEITLTNLTEGIYVFSVTATNANGQHRDEVTVTVSAGGSTGESQGIIPRAFSPNGDGEDDLWIWPNNEHYANSQLTVMNQSGQIVYEKNSYDNTWDGTLDGKPLEKGQYQYTITGIKNGKPVQASVRIVR